MIKEITIENFLSYRDKVTFSMEATKEKMADDCQVVEVAPGVRLLRFALIYGYNASGKSNFLEVFRFLSSFWRKRTNNQDKDTGVIPFLLDQLTPKKPSSFEIVFYLDATKYKYDLTIDSQKVIEEKLDFYPGSQPKNLFRRCFVDGQSEIQFNPSVQKVSDIVKEQISVRCLNNMSFFAARNQVNCSLDYTDVAMHWLTENIMGEISPNVSMMDYAIRKISKDEQLKSYILLFAHKADFNITNIITETQREHLPDQVCNFIKVDPRLTQEEKDEMLAAPYFDNIVAHFVSSVENSRGNETYQLDSELQSQGTMRMIGIETAIYNTMKQQGVLPIDELESSLHPDLLEEILEKFLGEGNRSQLIVATHYDPLLNTVDDLIRKDSVWFTEKEKDGNSILYPLTDFKGLNRISSFQKYYRNGRFGAVPNILK